MYRKICVVKKVFLHKEENLDELTDFLYLARELNVKRIVYMAVIFLIIQLMNLFDPAFYGKDLAIIGFFIICIFSIIYIILVKQFYRKIVNNFKLARLVFFSFLLSLFVGSSLYIISDVMTTGLPINAILFCVFLVIMPVFMFFEALIVFSLFLLINLAIAIFAHASFFYILTIIYVTVLGFIFSYFILRQYVYIILKLKMENRIDHLTGILNRRGGLEKTQTMLELCKRNGGIMALYIVDIDFFKSYNDTYGHQKGDWLLQQVAKAIEGIFERRSDIVFRYGGEEFVVCVLIAHQQDAAVLAENILKEVEGLHIEAINKTVSEYLTVSVGYTLYMPNSLNLSEDEGVLVSQADKALYWAKAQGCNRYGFFSDM